MFADSFRLVSIHCVARGLGASFLNSVSHRAVVLCDSTAFFLVSLGASPFLPLPLLHLTLPFFFPYPFPTILNSFSISEGMG